MLVGLRQSYKATIEVRYFTIRKSGTLGKKPTQIMVCNTTHVNRQLLCTDSCMDKDNRTAMSREGEPKSVQLKAFKDTNTAEGHLIDS